MKKILVFFISLILSIVLYSCNYLDSGIWMICDTTSINDHSFNSQVWEAIEDFSKERKTKHSYYNPFSNTSDGYISAINYAVEKGASVIILPGSLFEYALYVSQAKYPTIKFILIDGEPHSLDYIYETTDNTINILFKEEEAGFLAGYAAAKDGYTNLGFIGGMKVPAVVRYGLGYVAGAYYAKKESNILDLNILADNYVYGNTFSKSYIMYNNAEALYYYGCDIIFACAGEANQSIFQASDDKEKSVIGVDIDQHIFGNNVVTSAKKDIYGATISNLRKLYSGNWDGGKTISLGISEDAVGLPTNNDAWNFNKFTLSDYNRIYDLLKSGYIHVPNDTTSLFTWNYDHTYNIPSDLIYKI